MTAIIETGGKQYKVAEGDTLFIEKLPVEAGDKITFDRVLAVIDGDKATFGTPVVEKAKVEAEVVKNGKGKKIIVYKMKPKKNYRSTPDDHRNVSYGGQPYRELPGGRSQRPGRCGGGHPLRRRHQRRAPGGMCRQ